MELKIKTCQPNLSIERIQLKQFEIVMHQIKKTIVKLAGPLCLWLAVACDLASNDARKSSPPNATPSLTITPLLGRTTETTEVYISGPKMSSDVSVSFTLADGSSGGDCTNIKLIDETSLKCMAPAAPGGTIYSLKLTRKGEAVLSLTDVFKYQLAPSIASLSPETAFLGGGDLLTITGTDFLPGAKILVGGNVCLLPQIDSTKISCRLPALPVSGNYQVSVTNTDNQTANAPKSFLVYASSDAAGRLSSSGASASTVSISYVTPSFGPIAGGSTLSIVGSGFVENSKVSISGVASPTVSFVSSSKLTAVTPPGSFGLKNLIVSTPTGQSAVGAYSYSYGFAPQVLSVSPNSGALAGGILITIQGAGFLNPMVQIGGVDCKDVQVLSETSLTCVTPSNSSGAKTIQVTNGDGQVGALAAAYTYYNGLSPVITAISPVSGAYTGGVLVTITGSNFLPGATVSIGGTVCDIVGVVSGSPFTCITRIAPLPGAKSLVITNPDGRTGTYNYFNFTGLAPTFTAVSPAQVPAAGGATIQITGSNFFPGTSVLISGTACTSLTLVSTGLMSCVVPALGLGLKTIQIIGHDFTNLVSAATLTYISGPAPTVTVLAPNAGPLAGGNTVTIFGSGFVTGTIATINAVPCTSTVVDSSTQLTCTVPAGNAASGVALGAKNVVATNPDTQSGSLSNGYTYQLTGSFAYTVIGAQDSAHLGYTVASAGDLNGDSKAEYMIAEPYAVLAGIAQGKVYVYNGANGALLCSLQSPSGIASGMFGASMASGDMNGDGKAELVIGEPGATSSTGGSKSNGGRVHIFAGSDVAACAGGTLPTVGAPVARTLEAASPEVGAKFGYAVAVGGVAGVAALDVIVGEPYAAGGGVQRGRVSIFKGSALGAAFVNTVTDTLFTAINSPSADNGSNFGFSVAAADVNGDGRSDIIVGEPHSSNGGIARGKFFAYSGADGSTSLFTGGNTCTGTTNYNQCGFSVARAGRLQSSQRDSIIVGEPFSANGTVFVYTLYATPTGSPVVDWTISGGAAGATFGWSVAGVGDVDRDGRDDFAIGSPSITSFKGEIRVYSSAAVGTNQLLYTLSGGEASAYFGNSVAGLGDLNGDGAADLIIGEWRAANQGNDRGRAYVWYSP